MCLEEKTVFWVQPEKLTMITAITATAMTTALLDFVSFRESARDAPPPLHPVLSVLIGKHFSFPVQESSLGLGLGNLELPSLWMRIWSLWFESWDAPRAGLSEGKELLALKQVETTYPRETESTKGAERDTCSPFPSTRQHFQLKRTNC